LCFAGGIADEGVHPAGEEVPAECRCEKRHFLRCHLYIKTIILPRQARDNHRESTQKRVAFFAGVGANFESGDYISESWKWIDMFRHGGLTMPWSEGYVWAWEVGEL
jgi:hypothetical protein